ncbi:hypothetical protein NPIL_28381 [Nephila pilipes]|uniref:Uncharacterized protein n=1 Tax=Nephila pilipes TaxID=299642 RepID=A0A8X6N4T4_NEPPI|nr:hypothetical protein NPIL_28381 [Nephila pilipes]
MVMQQTARSPIARFRMKMFTLEERFRYRDKDKTSTIIVFPTKVRRMMTDRVTTCWMTAPLHSFFGQTVVFVEVSLKTSVTLAVTKIFGNMNRTHKDIWKAIVSPCGMKIC